MSVLFGPLMLAAIQAFAGNAANFSNRTLEWPWYAFWVQAFYGVFDPAKVIAGPQYEIAKQIRSNDGKSKLKKRFPDFALHYLSGFPRNHNVDNLLQVTNHDELLQFSMGRFVIVDSFLLAICKIKALPDPRGIPASEAFQSVLYRAIDTLQAEARVDAQRQAGLYLSTKKDIDSVVAIAAFGPHFSWRVFTRDAVTDISSNEDPTFVPHDSDSTSDSLSATQRRATRYICHFPMRLMFEQFACYRKKCASRIGLSTIKQQPDEIQAVGSS